MHALASPVNNASSCPPFSSSQPSPASANSTSNLQSPTSTYSYSPLTSTVRSIAHALHFTYFSPSKSTSTRPRTNDSTTLTTPKRNMLGITGCAAGDDQGRSDCEPLPPTFSPITPHPRSRLLFLASGSDDPFAPSSTPSTDVDIPPTPIMLGSRASSTSTSPLTEFSTTPSPPPPDFSQPERSICSYPSPSSLSSSQLSSIESSPAPEGGDNASSLEKRTRGDDEAAPPAKKRRVSSDPKPRVTQHLDLSASTVGQAEQKEQMDKLMKVLSKSRKIVVVAGAGISVSAGIPDFRSGTGLFKSLKKQHKLKSSGKDMFDASVYRDDKSTQNFHQMLREMSKMSEKAKPSPFHAMLATLAEEGRLLRLYTQNVDGLDTQMDSLKTTVPLPRKGPWPKSVQLHGGLQHMVCSKCHDVSAFDEALFDGPTPPSCEKCEAADNVRTEYGGKRSHGVGCLRPRMVLYNEHNPDDEAIGSVSKADLRTRPDALIVVGTTLKIPGVRRIVKEMGGVVRGRREGSTIWINMNAPPPGFDWDLIVSGPCDRVAEEAKMMFEHALVSGEQLKAIKKINSVSVEIPASPTSARKAAQRPNLAEIPPPNTVEMPGDGEEGMATPTKKRAPKLQDFKLALIDNGKAKKLAAEKKPRKASGVAKKPRAKQAPAAKNKTITFGIAKSVNVASSRSKDLELKIVGAEGGGDGQALGLGLDLDVVASDLKTLDVAPMTSTTSVTVDAGQRPGSGEDGASILPARSPIHDLLN